MAIGVRDVDALFEEYQARGAKILNPPTDRDLGGRSMAVEGPDGNVVGFATMLDDDTASSHPETDAAQ